MGKALFSHGSSPRLHPFAMRRTAWTNPILYHLAAESGSAMAPHGTLVTFFAAPVTDDGVRPSRKPPSAFKILHPQGVSCVCPYEMPRYPPCCSFLSPSCSMGIPSWSEDLGGIVPPHLGWTPHQLFTSPQGGPRDSVPHFLNKFQIVMWTW